MTNPLTMQNHDVAIHVEPPLVPPAMETSAGKIGRYHVVKPLGQGGMAEVFLARREGPGGFARHVALKVLDRDRSRDEEACAMFVAEARVVAMLDHHNIAQVIDVAAEDGVHYLAMEFVHGVDLRELLRACGEQQVMPSFEVALEIVLRAAAGLDHAHRRCDANGQPLRLVHRDVSLSNIMVGHDGSVKVVDFGIARSTLSTVETMPGVVRGKASYMSPEQCSGAPVDHRTDVFALGVVLYELTTGARCFDGDSDFERMVKIVRGEYVPPTAINPDYPPELEAVVRTALAPDPDQRYASCAAMIQALESVMCGYGWNAGGPAIVRAMRGLYGTVDEPWAAPRIDVPVDTADKTIETPTVAARPATTSRTRLARGSMPDVPKPWYDDDDEAMTRGRHPISRWSTAAA